MDSHNDTKDREHDMRDAAAGNEGQELNQDAESSDADAIAKRDADFSRLEDKVELDELRKRVSAAEQEAEDHKDKYLRALAELENVKKRAIKDRSDLLKYQGERVFTELLPLIDNLELALQHAESDPGALKSGLQLIHKLFVDTLGKWEVRSESALGKEFDPVRHSALSKVPTKDAKAGTVLNEFRKAYLYKDKLLRPAEVVVAAEPPAEETPRDEGGDPQKGE